MIELDRPFTDGHGITHMAPVFAVTAMHRNLGKYEHSSLDLSSMEYGGGDRMNCSVNYEVVYWTSKEAMENGRKPMQLIRDNDERGFYLEPDVESPMSLLEICEAHFTSTFVDLIGD